MTNHTIGVDISKAQIDVHRLWDGQKAVFDNTSQGHKAFVRWIGKEPVERIVFEPTGKYHLDFEASLGALGLPLCKVNPLHVRHFAKAIGTRAKTDPVDARLLARMGQSLQPELMHVPGPQMRQLKELQGARTALIKDRTAAKNRAKAITLPLLKKQNCMRIRQIERDIAAIEKAMQAIIDKDAQLSRTFQIICSIPGISTITATAIIVELPEIGTLTNKQIASLAGLAPFTRQSGKWKGKAFIGAGRKFLRESLYMPALVATRFNEDMQVIYLRLTEKGKPPKLAVTAIMRKLIILANTLVREDRTWKKKTA